MPNKVTTPLALHELGDYAALLGALSVCHAIGASASATATSAGVAIHTTAVATWDDLLDAAPEHVELLSRAALPGGGAGQSLRSIVAREPGDTPAAQLAGAIARAHNHSPSQGVLLAALVQVQRDPTGESLAVHPLLRGCKASANALCDLRTGANLWSGPIAAATTINGQPAIGPDLPWHWEPTMGAPDQWHHDRLRSVRLLVADGIRRTYWHAGAPHHPGWAGARDGIVWPAQWKRTRTLQDLATSVLPRRHLPAHLPPAQCMTAAAIAVSQGQSVWGSPQALGGQVDTLDDLRQAVLRRGPLLNQRQVALLLSVNADAISQRGRRGKLPEPFAWDGGGRALWLPEQYPEAAGRWQQLLTDSEVAGLQQPILR